MKKNKNVYKPRYKVPFQAKTKLWAYKNSHLRHFYSIRGKKLYRNGYFRKTVLVATTLKWTVARRFIRPGSRRLKPRRGSSRYRNNFYLKQQVKHFYGKLKEVDLRSIYKTHLLNTFDRNKSFFGALEQRADMFLFRMRLFPTIYACNQFVHHQGLLLNNLRLEKCPSALIKIGYTISLPKKYWNVMCRYIKLRIFYRLFGKYRTKRRMYTALKKKVLWLKGQRKKFRKKEKSVFMLTTRLLFLKMFVAIRKMFILFQKLLYGVITVKQDFSKYDYKDHPDLLKYIERIYKIFLKIPALFVQFKYLYQFFWSYLLKTAQSKSQKTPRILMVILLKNYTILRNVRYFFDDLKEAYVQYITYVTIENLKQSHITSIELMAKYKLSPTKTFQREKDTMEVPVSEVKAYLENQWRYFLKYSAGFMREQFLVREHANYLHIHNYLRYCFIVHKKRSRLVADKVKKKEMYRPRALIYFILNSQYKTRRKRLISRLKKVHWYIPHYIYFDVKTLRATLLYVPRANEIVLPFKCSLFRIFSFYKALGL